MVCPASFGIAQEIVVPDDCYGPGFHGSILSEYTQLFGLADHLAHLAEKPANVYLFQYRKFVTSTSGSRRSSNMPHAFASDPTEAHELFPEPDVLAGLPGQLLTVPALKLERSIALQYAAHHPVEDFAALAVACSLSGALNPDQIGRFINCPILFPSPALCLMPTPVFLEMMSTLRKVWQAFVPHFLQKREGYQRRVGGFLLERLHSFLLLDHITSLPVERTTVGKLVIVSESEVVQPTI